MFRWTKKTIKWSDTRPKNGYFQVLFIPKLLFWTLNVRTKMLLDFNFEYFWQWSDFQSYLECTLVFVSFGSLLMYLCIRFYIFFYNYFYSLNARELSLLPLSKKGTKMCWAVKLFRRFNNFYFISHTTTEVLSFIVSRVDPFVEAVGFAAVFTEAMLGTPQFYRNYCNKSTYGMR